MTVRFDNFSERADYSPYGVARQRPPADLNGDGAVDGTDQLIFFNAWGAAFGPGAYNPDADINFDGQVNGDDFLILNNNFGATPAPPGAVSQHGNTIGYSGYIYDEAINMSLARFRWYDAETGRWATRDPIGYADGSNMYMYIHGAPYNSTDPHGLQAVLPPAYLGQSPHPYILPSGRTRTPYYKGNSLIDAMASICRKKGNCSGCTVNQCIKEAHDIVQRYFDAINDFRSRPGNNHTICVDLSDGIGKRFREDRSQSGGVNGRNRKCWKGQAITDINLGHSRFAIGHACDTHPSIELDPFKFFIRKTTPGNITPDWDWRRMTEPYIPGVDLHEPVFPGLHPQKDPFPPFRPGPLRHG